MRKNTVIDNEKVWPWPRNMESSTKQLDNPQSLNNKKKPIGTPQERWERKMHAEHGRMCKMSPQSLKNFLGSKRVK